MWMKEKHAEMDIKRNEYQKRYDEELLLYNMKKKPMPKKVRIALICLCLLGIALWVVWVAS